MNGLKRENEKLMKFTKNKQKLYWFYGGKNLYENEEIIKNAINSWIFSSNRKWIFWMENGENV